MKKKNFLYFIFFLFILFTIVCCTFYCTLKFYNYFIDVYKREVVVNDNNLSSGIENVYDSVVVVENYNSSFELNGTGSGFIFSSKGYIITNQHVISNAKTIKVVLVDGTVLDASIIGQDEYDDIAVLKIDTKEKLSVANIGKSEDVKLGDTVFTVGTPLNSKYIGTVTRGILSGKDRLIEVSVNSTTNDWIMKVMQTDASLNPGNSGGPLCDINGNVIGVNTMKISENEIEGIGFAIPIEDAVSIANKIITGETIKRVYLGISMADINVSSLVLNKYGIRIDKSIHSGVIVVDVFENSSCDKAGIMKGDVIISVGKYETKNIAELKYYLSKYSSFDTVDLSVLRNNKKVEFKIFLEER